ncbi:MAG: hypothetical protein D6724_06770 [Armatimonadetes bacterium]|nr:MAG: hypothetical protein D6724_06770 [Armatimonadota bacterium]
MVLDGTPFEEIPDHPALNPESSNQSNGKAVSKRSVGSVPANIGTSREEPRGREVDSGRRESAAEPEPAPEPTEAEIADHGAWVDRCVECVLREFPEGSVLLRRAIQNATQVKFGLGNDQATVNFYNTGRVVVNGSPNGTLIGRLKEIAWPKWEDKRRAPGGVNRTFLILDVNEESMTEALARVEGLAIRNCQPNEHMLFAWELIRGEERLRLHAYKTEKVTLQGARGGLASEVERALEDEMVRSHREYRRPPQPRPLPEYQTLRAAQEVAEYLGEGAWKLLERWHSSLAFCWYHIHRPPEGHDSPTYLVSSIVQAFESFFVEFASLIDVGNPIDPDGKNAIAKWITAFERRAVERRDPTAEKLAKRMRDAWKDRHAFVHDDRRKEPMLDARGCRERALWRYKGLDSRHYHHRW